MAGSSDSSTAARLESVDVAKGIGIIAIVLGHIGLYGPNGAELLEPWLYQFHVPVFFVVAGYFLSTKRMLGAFALQKAQRLLLPYAATAGAVVAATALQQLAGGGSVWPGTFANVGDAVLAALYGSGSWYNPTPFSIAPIGAIWFLPALFTALVISRACLQWRRGWLIAAALGATSFATARVFWLPFSIQPGCVGALFVLFGTWLRKRGFLTPPDRGEHGGSGHDALSKHTLAERAPGWRAIALLACASLFVIAGAFNLKLSLASLLTATNPLLALVVGAASSLLCLKVSRLVSKHAPHAARVLAFYGRGSLTVLCVHLFAIDAGLNTLIAAATGLGGNALSALLIAVHLGLAAACIPLFRKVPGLRKLWP